MKNLIQNIEKHGLTMGCEFTFWPKNSRGWSRKPANLVKKAFGENAPSWMLRRATEEDKLFECPSDPADTFEKLREQWKQFDKVVTSNKGKYRYYTYDSGGGHIHLKLPFSDSNLLLKFKKVLLTLISNHPEVVWAFNGPRDNHNAKIPALAGFMVPSWRISPAMKKRATQINYGMFEFNFAGWLELKDVYFKHNIAANLRTLGTVEYRFIDAPSSEFQLELSLAVCAAFHLKALEIVKNNKPIPALKYTKEDYAKIEWHEARQNLIDFAVENGLPKNKMVQQFKNLKCKFFPEEYFKGKFKHRELLV